MLLVNRILTAIFFIGIFSTTGNSYTVKTDIAEDGKRYPGGHEKITYNSIYRINHSPSVMRALTDNESTITDATTNEDSRGLYLTHFFNPSTNKGLYGIFATAKEKAVSYYKLAVKDKSWKYLGHSLHLLQDMAVPSHANGIPHMYQADKKIGFEWWVTRNWDLKVQPLVNFLFADSSYAEPIGSRALIADLTFSMATATQASGYKLDYGYGDWLVDYEHGIYGDTHIEMNAYEAEEAFHFLVPSAIRVGGGLFEKFYVDFNYPSTNNTGPGGAHPDDNFDVSSRLIELEELDVTKQAWKDLYGRTAIKKGYNGLFLEKTLTSAYANIAAKTNETDYNAAAQQFQTILDRAQKEAKHSFEETYYASADVALLSDAFVDNAAELLLKRLKEPIREVKETLDPSALLKNQPVLLIPSGALVGLADSAMLKASFDQYVKNGGTLIVLTQKHGYDYAAIPTPDGSPITGYGWEEDQNCFADSVAIETWHQMLSGQSRTTPTVNVDGYFTGYPVGSTILLRRTANGQPALLMYEHGQGRVILTSMYSDWAYGHGQASQEEVALVRDILTWAKRPSLLPEVRAGDTATVPIELRNTTSTAAASAMLQIFTPDRSTLLSEQLITFPIPADQTAITTVSWQSPAGARLGIYHIDYILLDAAGNVIQPQAETDSGRFVVSRPPLIGTISKDIWLSATTPNQQVFFNEPFVYSLHVFNNSAKSRNLTVKNEFRHTARFHEWQLTVDPNSETTVSGSELFIDSRYMFETMRSWVYDEDGKEIGTYDLSFKGIYPKAETTTTTGKSIYDRGETVNFAVNLKNGQNVATAVKLTIKVIDPANMAIFSSSRDMTLEANGTNSQPFSFALTANAQAGSYTISTEAFDTANNKIGGDAAPFEILLSRITVIPELPAALVAGASSFPFKLTNSGKVAVNRGTLDVTLKDPDGVTVAAAVAPFAIDQGQEKTVNVSIPMPALKFGTYTFTYTQSDETRSSRPTTVLLANVVTPMLSFDKASYRIRESASLALTLTNSGRFNLESASVTVTVADAGFADTRSVTIGQGQTQPLQYAIALPETMAVGEHAVSVTITLPGGASVVKSAVITVPQSSLAFSLAQSAFTAGAVITPAIANSGGIDTQAQYRLTLYDAKSAIIAEKSLTETVTANGLLAVNLPIPAGASAGGYVLVVTCNDLKTGKVEIEQKSLTITGAKAALTLRTDKQSYLSSESVVALSSIANGDAALQAGNLHLQVTNAGGSQVKKSWTSQYDFQQGSRSGVDTFSLPDSVTLTSFNDSFDAGFLNLDRWKPFASSAGGPPPTVVNGRLLIEMPNPGYWPASTADLIAPVTGDFDTQVDYQVDSANSSDGSKHPASLCIYNNNGMFLWVDLWGSMTYGTCDLNYQCNNAGGGQYTGKFRIRRIGSTYSAYYWNGNGWSTILTTYNRPVGQTYIRLVVNGLNGKVKTYYDNFTVTTQTYPASGTLNLKYDAGRSEAWDKLSFSGDIPNGTSMTFRTRSAEAESGLASAAWSGYITTSGSPVTSPKGRWLEVETTLSTSNSANTPTLHELTVTQGHNPGDLIWQTEIPANLAPNVLGNLNNAIGTTVSAGKYYLQGSLFSSTGQSIAAAEYPFYVVKGNTLLSFTADKKFYRPGETVTISGEVKNLAAVEAANLAFSLRRKLTAAVEQTLYASTFNLTAGESQPFSITTAVGAEGVAALTGTIIQNGETVAETADRYEVAAPKVTAAAAIPAVAGNDPFTVTLTLANTGKTEASVTVIPSTTSLAEIITIPSGQTKLLQYSRQISTDSTETFTISGDLVQTIEQQVKYGPSATLAVTPAAIYPEGKITLPVTVTNSGLTGSRFSIDYQLTQGASSINQQTKSYYIASGASSADNMSFDLAEGSYQLTATSRLPAVSALSAFQVRKETRADMTLAVGAEAGGAVPVTINLTNLGYNRIDGTLQLAVLDANGNAVWSADQEVGLLQALDPLPQAKPFSINLAAAMPGSYTIKAELLDNANRQLAMQSAPFTLLGPVFKLTRVPDYQAVASGGIATMTFKVKNNGNQDGVFELAFKADDLADSTRSEWLKPGEEMEIAFNFQTAIDLDEKDYTTTYRLKSAGTTVTEGIVEYRLTGLNLAVSATLDKQNYNEGDTAILTLTITQQDNGAGPNLFARVNYAGYEEKQDLVLAGSQTLIFTVPLSRVTGEKLFYGIYHQTGRSIHLNTIYIHKADAALAITTDKQVYQPGEAVAITITGTAIGDLTLTGPGNFSTAFAFAATDNRSLVLPSIMTAGTYTITGKLTEIDGSMTNALQPFDVAGIQVKIKEALLDKARYAASDTMNLSLTIESNQNLTASLKTWVVDPSGSYTAAGESNLNLAAATPVLSTSTAQLSTASTGIHKLVYGLYQGDLLLASGAKAFDMGDAVLLGLSSDRSDYPEVTMPVVVKTELFGSLEAGIELFLDGTSVRTDTLSLAGFATQSYSIPSAALAPGMHVIKAVLTSGGLTSIRESRFTWGSSLSDLTARVAASPPDGETVGLSVTIANLGKAAAGGSRVAIYNGNPADGGQLLTTLEVPSLAAGASAVVLYPWNIIGKAGEHLIYAVADCDNNVLEFIEANNTAFTAFNLPNLSIGVAATKPAFKANEDAVFNITLANLTIDKSYDGAILKLGITAPGGTTFDLSDRSVASIAAGSKVVMPISWNTAVNPPGVYSVSARLMSGTSELSAGSISFGINPTILLSGSITPEKNGISQGAALKADYTLTDKGNVDARVTVRGSLVNPADLVLVTSLEQELDIAVNGTFTGSFALSTNGLPAGVYSLVLNLVAPAPGETIATAVVTLLDIIPPTITVSTLADGSYTNQETLNVAGTVQDNSGTVSLEVNGSAATVAADGSFSQAIILQDGSNPITVTAVDLANNRSSDSRTIILDRKAPLLQIIVPADNSKTAVALTEVSGTVDETSTVTVRLGNEVRTAAMNGTGFISGVTLLPGTNTIEVIARDLAENPSSQKRTVLFDDQAPSLAVTEPVQDIRTNKNSLTVSGTTSDPYSSVGITVAVYGTVMSPPVINGIFSQLVAFDDEKLYPIKVTATNEVGTQTTAVRNVIFDKTPPTLTIDPVMTPTNSATQTVTGTREEGTDVVVSCTTAATGAVEYPTGTTWKVALGGMQQGENRLQAEATDLAGNRATAGATVLYLPQTPHVTICASPRQLWPANKKLVAVTIDGKVVSHGADIRSVTVSVADEYGKYNRQGVNFGDAIMLEAWRKGDDLDGRVYTITAVVTDQAGNRTTKTTTVVVPHDRRDGHRSEDRDDNDCENHEMR